MYSRKNKCVFFIARTEAERLKLMKLSKARMSELCWFPERSMCGARGTQISWELPTAVAPPSREDHKQVHEKFLHRVPR